MEQFPLAPLILGLVAAVVLWVIGQLLGGGDAYYMGGVRRRIGQALMAVGGAIFLICLGVTWYYRYHR